VDRERCKDSFNKIFLRVFIIAVYGGKGMCWAAARYCLLW
jgi:hypothetical protein